MIDSALSHDERGRLAEAAWSELPHGGRASILLRVQCRNGHHVAAVYATRSGQVYVAPVRAHSHGAYDLPDEPHRDQRPQHWFDLIDEAEEPTADDALPAWCDCGHRSLSRAAVQEWIRSGEHRVVID